ncbi:MAG: hypothetical protein ACRDTH_05825, partial [Pseudonocardiaceae bacterium]
HRPTQHQPTPHPRRPPPHHLHHHHTVINIQQLPQRDFRMSETVLSFQQHARRQRHDEAK